MGRAGFLLRPLLWPVDGRLLSMSPQAHPSARVCGWISSCKVTSQIGYEHPHELILTKCLFRDPPSKWGLAEVPGVRISAYGGVGDTIEPINSRPEGLQAVISHVSSNKSLSAAGTPFPYQKGGIDLWSPQETSNREGHVLVGAL